MKLTTYLHKPIPQSWLTESNSLLVHLEYSFFYIVSGTSKNKHYYRKCNRVETVCISSRISPKNILYT